MSSLPLQHITPVRIAHHADALPNGTRLGEFEVVALLGVGGFGMVYQAFDHSLLRFVAIKEYMPSSLASRGEGAALQVDATSDEPAFKAGLESFIEEARLLARFDHPSLVKVFRFWEENQTAYMVMPLYSGMTFKQARAHMRTPPPEAWLRKVLWSVTSALRVLHEARMLHRDISPDNIFLQDTGPPVLLDLGAARQAISDSETKHSSALKVNYAPLELYTDEAGSSALQQGPWSDLYSLGAVVHGCLCNDAPLPATLRAIRDRMASFSRVTRIVRKQFGLEYSAPFVDAVSQALALQPASRPQSVDAWLQIMNMRSAPPGLDNFDFRTELGNIWVEPLDADAPGVAQVVIGTTQVSVPAPPLPPMPPSPQRASNDEDSPPSEFQATVMQEHAPAAFADTRAIEPRAHRQPSGQRAHRRSPHDNAAAPAEAANSPARRRRPLALWIAAGLLAVAVIGAIAALLWRDSAPPPAPAPSSAAGQAEPAQPPPAPPASEQTPPPPAQDNAPAPPQDSAPQEEPTPAPTPAPAPKPRLPRKAAAPAPAPSIQESVVPLTPAPAPAPPPAPTPAPPPPSPEKTCASEGLFGRPMCIYRECQKAGMANQPVCVENRRRREQEERREQN